MVKDRAHPSVGNLNRVWPAKMSTMNRMDTTKNSGAPTPMEKGFLTKIR
jgi:hypothetical protein